MIAPVLSRQLADPLAEDPQDVSGAIMYDAIQRPTTQPKRVDRDGNPEERPAAHHGRRERHGKRAHRSVAEEVFLEELAFLRRDPIRHHPQPERDQGEDQESQDGAPVARSGSSVMRMPPRGSRSPARSVILTQIVIDHQKPTNQNVKSAQTAHGSKIPQKNHEGIPRTGWTSALPRGCDGRL